MSDPGRWQPSSCRLRPWLRLPGRCVQNTASVTRRRGRQHAQWEVRGPSLSLLTSWTRTPQGNGGIQQVKGQGGEHAVEYPTQTPRVKEGFLEEVTCHMN